MCLTKLKKVYSPPKKVKKTAYAFKVMATYIGDSNLYFPFFLKYPAVLLGDTVEDTKEYMLEVEDISHRYYTTGFHVFSKYKDALSYRVRIGPRCTVVVKVAIDNIVAIGKQDCWKTLVVKKMEFVELCA